MKYFITILLSTFFLNHSQAKQKLPKIKTGKWSASLTLTDTTELPFAITINKTKQNYSFYIHNSEEIIELKDLSIKGDTLKLQFPSFNSSLNFVVKNNKELNGYWLNLNKSDNYKIPFHAKFGYVSRFKKTNETLPQHVSGKWKVTFEPNTKDAYPAIGLFKQEAHKISGTFLTETGDYRYLEGNQYGNEFYISCFDGSHAFLFKAKVVNNILKGTFYSGTHWQSEWIGERNENYHLPNPDSLTVLINKDVFTFDLTDLNGNNFHFPNPDFKNKVVIIQIMGTWCPNCMDETRFYKELYNKYHKDGLEIIAVGYEVGDDFEDYARKIELLKTRLNLDFKFVVGGRASKQLASEQFPMLSEIISFPTSIFLNSKGEVVRIHTGFNGPGTGEFYNEYKEKTTLLIESLLGIKK
jgi:thiol-disulfide isomerase/thioredoxin